MPPRPTGLEMSLIVTLHCIPLAALLAHPLLAVGVLPSVVLLDSDEIAQSVAGVVVQAARLRAHEHPLLRLAARNRGG